MKLSYLPLLLFSFFSTQAISQTAEDVLSRFFAVQQEDKVLLRWTIIRGNTCEDTYVERSVDGGPYERIGLIGGICGSPDASITYDFYDTVPVPNRFSAYRLLLGLYGYTEPRNVEFILLNDEGFSLQPNPMTEKSWLVFDNPRSEEFTLRIYDMRGKMVYSITTDTDRFLIYREGLGSGQYFFTLEGSDRKMSGKLIVI